MSRATAFPIRSQLRSAKTQISPRTRRLIWVFSVRLKMLWIFGYPQTALRRLWPDCADAHANLSLRWALMQCCRKYCAPVRMSMPLLSTYRAVGSWNTSAYREFKINVQYVLIRLIWVFAVRLWQKKTSVYSCSNVFYKVEVGREWEGWE